MKQTFVCTLAVVQGRGTTLEIDVDSINIDGINVDDINILSTRFKVEHKKPH